MKKVLMATLSLLGATCAFASVDINTASAAELATLPGIGPSKANAIIQYRHQNGLFEDFDDLKNVAGINSGIIEMLREEAVLSH